MKIQKLNPTSPGARHQIKIKKNSLSKKNNFYKKDIKHLKNFSGRSSVTGRITVRHKGGGSKKTYKSLINKNFNSIFIIVAVIYDQNRKSFISVIFNPFLKMLSFSVTTDFQCVGNLIESGTNTYSKKSGTVLTFKQISTGSIVNSISFKNKISVFIKSAGNFGQVIQKTLSHVKIKLPSGKILIINTLNNWAVLGAISNKDQKSVMLGKAGRSRLLKKRPSVRGIAMNPVDHPHGGRTNGGRTPVSPWGKITKGAKTKKS